MRRLDYVVNLAGEGYSVMSYIPFHQGTSSVTNYRPIQMTVLRNSFSKNKQNISQLIEASSLLELTDYSILYDAHSNWVLIEFQVLTGGLKLIFVNLDSNDQEDFFLNLSHLGMPLILDLQFVVPRLDSTISPVTYKVFMQYKTFIKGDPMKSEIIVNESGGGIFRTLSFISRQNAAFLPPDSVSITEYVDM